MDYTRSELEKKNYRELQALCKQLTGKPCGRVKKDAYIDKILSFQSGGSPRRSPVKKTKKRKSPKKAKKRRSPSRSPKRKSPKRGSPERQDLAKLKVNELKKIMKDEGIPEPKGTGKNGNVLKGDRVRAIIDARSRGTASPVRKQKVERGSPSRVVLRCDDGGKNRCTGIKSICYTEDGTCKKPIKNGTPWGAPSLKKKLGDEYYFDPETGLVGRKADVLAHIEKWGKSPRRSPTPKRRTPKKKPTPRRSPTPKRRTPKKKSTPRRSPTPKRKPTPKRRSPKRKASPKKTLLNCQERDCGTGKVCNAKTGRCVKDTPAQRKKNYTLQVNGRTIVGNKSDIEKLQGILGGRIAAPGKGFKSPTREPEVVSEPEISESEDEPELTAAEIRRMEKGKEKVSPKRSPKRSPPRKSPKISSAQKEQQEQKVLRTFQECLAGYSK